MINMYHDVDIHIVQNKKLQIIIVCGYDFANIFNEPVVNLLVRIICGLCYYNDYKIFVFCCLTEVKRFFKHRFPSLQNLLYFSIYV